jgi:DNA-binding response OmpR family regulator
MEPVKILVVDDDESIRALLKTALSREGWRVLLANSGNEGLAEAEKNDPDLIILDIILPGLDGFEVCREIRRWSEVPIIALSCLIKTEDKVKILNLGATDYVTKPFAVEELNARIKASLRYHRANLLVSTESPLICGNIRIDFEKRRVFVDSQEVKLAPLEFSLLAELTKHDGKILSYDELLKKVWGEEFAGERDYLYVQISHLRDKLESDPVKPQHIISVPKTGYRFEK